MAITAEEKRAFLEHHIPHRLCLLTTFRDRQGWFEERIEQNDGDLLRASKDSALISIRLFAHFLGLRQKKNKNTGAFELAADSPADIECRKTKSADCVFVTDLDGELAKLDQLSEQESALLDGLLTRANTELAHLTSSFKKQRDFNTARNIVDGLTVIERLLRRNLYDVVSRQNGEKYPFPDLKHERRIRGHGYEIVDRPVFDPSWEK
jgi:hypothetical protein